MFILGPSIEKEVENIDDYNNKKSRLIPIRRPQWAKILILSCFFIKYRKFVQIIVLKLSILTFNSTCRYYLMEKIEKIKKFYP